MSGVRYRFVALAVALLVISGSSACAGVRPYEREHLAKRGMLVDADPAVSALDQHVYEYREGSSGGYTASGGSGCGCN